jgi:predicted MFS family arabinose efflux permease
MLPLAFFRRRDFTAAQIVAFGISASMFAGYLYLTIYLQSVLGLSPIQTGLVYLPATVLCFVVSGATASMAERVPPAALIIAGLGLAVIGLALMTMTGADSSWTAIEPGLIVAMAGVGLINPVLSGLALGSVSDAQSGLAAGANDTFRQAGIAIGVAGLGALVPVRVTDPAAFVTGLHHALLAGAGLAAVSAIAVAILIGQRTGAPAVAAEAA